MLRRIARLKASGDGAELMAAIFLVTGTVLYLLFGGWVLSVMWNWFMPNIFDSLPRLSIGEAVGLWLVASVFLDPLSKEYEEKDPRKLFIKTLQGPVFNSLMLLAVGFIVHVIVF